MSKKHNKISSAERDKIAPWVSQKVGVREIARRLGRSPGSISNELARNSHVEVGYIAIHAQQLTDERKKEARKRQPLKSREIFAYVQEKLRRGWSPEMIAGRLEKGHGRRVIHHETIYRYIYSTENAPPSAFMNICPGSGRGAGRKTAAVSTAAVFRKGFPSMSGRRL